MTASLARLHQWTQSVRNAESVVGAIFPAELPTIAGRHGVPAIRSDQAELGLDYRPSPRLRVSAHGYTRNLSGLLLVGATEGEPFLTGAPATGVGSATGVTADAEWRSPHLALTASFGVQRIRFRHAGAAYVPQHGATQRIDAGIALTPGSSTTIRVGLSGAWGRRTTAVASGGFEWEACNLRDRGCEFGGSPHYQGETLGGTALPPYLRIDLGVRQELRFGAAGRHASATLYGTFTNLLGRTNLLTLSRDPLSGEQRGIEMRPRAPLVIGMEWQF